MATIIHGTTGITTNAVNASGAITGASLDLVQPLAIAEGGTGASDIPPYKMVLGTAVATTSGTSHDFTGIPSWVKRITVMLNGVSTNSTSPVRLLLGAGSIETTGYSSNASVSGIGNTGSTSGFDRYNGTAADVSFGTYYLVSMGSNTWAVTSQYYFLLGNNPGFITGGKTLSGALDRIRLTTVNGTDTFDAGSVNIMYEGY